MNTIFIDICDFRLKNEKKLSIIDIIKSKFFKVAITKDFIADDINKNVLLKIDINFLNKVLENKNKVYEKILKVFLKKEFSKIGRLNIVCSKEIDRNKKYKNYIINLFYTTFINLEICDIKIQNDILKHDTIYIDNMLKNSNIDKSRANILIVINNIEDIKEEKIIEYIKKYKYVDILRLDGISKSSFKILLKRLDVINDEYGTTIEIIQRRNICEYDVYTIYSNINLEEFKNHYILNSNARILNTKNEEEDTLNLSYRMYNKNKYNLEVLFNRINYDMSRFSKIKLGNLYK